MGVVVTSAIFRFSSHSGCLFNPTFLSEYTPSKRVDLSLGEELIPDQGILEYDYPFQNLPLLRIARVELLTVEAKDNSGSDGFVGVTLRITI